jgi:hypothetical protein
MNRLLRVCFVCAAVNWAGSSHVLAVAKDAPYEFIAGRNVFKLHGPLLAPVPPVQPPPPKAMPKVIVTGLTDVCGRRQVLAEISEPGQPTIEPVLAEGEEAGLVRVIHIDVARSLVSVRINGEESTLVLHSPAVPATPQPIRR